MRPGHSTSGPASGNAWVDCACGQRHWGRYGAAGLLVVSLADDTAAESAAAVLLQHRAQWTHEGGTWALPGGARGEDESAATAALREAGEEAGLRPELVRILDTTSTDHGPWSYTYVIGTVEDRPHLSPADEETQDLAWVPLDRVTDYPLHPLFALAWPALQARVEELLSRR
jgi:8-oxo-dGTP diphosphatase